MKLKLLSLAALAVIIYSCASKSGAATVAAKETKPEAAPSSEPVPTFSVATVMTPEIAEGKQLFDNNCTGCHRAYKSEEFSAAEWAPIIKRMQVQANLNDEQGKKIYNYLTAK